MQILSVVSFILLVLGTPGWLQAQGTSPAYSGDQQEFFEKCRTEGNLQWFYDCSCAADYYPVLEDSLRGVERTRLLENTERQCERGYKQAFHPLKPGDRTRYDSCEILEDLKAADKSDFEVRSTSVEMAFQNAGVCKDPELIRVHSFSECHPVTGETKEETEARCACSSEVFTQRYMDFEEGLSQTKTRLFRQGANRTCLRLSQEEGLRKVQEYKQSSFFARAEAARAKGGTAESLCPESFNMGEVDRQPLFLNHVEISKEREAVMNELDHRVMIGIEHLIGPEGHVISATGRIVNAPASNDAAAERAKVKIEQIALKSLFTPALKNGEAVCVKFSN